MCVVGVSTGMLVKHSVFWVLLVVLTSLMSTHGVKMAIDECRSYCPSLCRTCEFRYAYAQYFLEIHCNWALGSSRKLEDLFKNCKHIDKINVLIVTEVDDIQQVLPLLSRCKSIRHLNLTSNRISSIPPGLFLQFENLQDLIMDHNNMERLPANSLSSSSIQRISLRYNRLAHISSQAIQGTKTSLSIIDLSHNDLQVLTHWPLKISRKNVNERLRIVLDYNQINRFTNNDDPVFQSKSGKTDSSETDTSVAWTHETMEQTNIALSLAGNKVQHLTYLINGWGMNKNAIQEFGRRRNFVIVSLHQNPLVCDCKDYYIYLSSYNISNIIPDVKVLPYCNKPQHLKFRSVYNANFQLMIRPQEFICKEECYESKCMCIEEPWRQALTVDCQGANLGRLPHRREIVPLPDGYTYRFNFSASRLSRQLPGMPSIYKDAKSLDLSGSGIESLSIKHFIKLRKLSEINLNHNLLTTLDRRIDEMTFPNLKVFRLDNNPWNCSCNNSWFAKWFKRMKPTFLYPAEIRCAEPSWLASMSLLDLTEKSFCEKPKPSSRNTDYNQLALSSTAISGAILIMTVAVLGLFCARVTLFTQCGLHPFDRDECEGEQKRCDAFILFHPLDTDWVVSSLVEKLTNRVHPFVLCTHDRACVPGLYTYNAVCHAIENSKRVIVVITPNFVNSVDVGTDYQLTVTYLTRTQPKQTNRLIHIVFPEVKHLPENLVRQRVLTAKNVVKYGSSNFWREILYRMPTRTMTSTSFSVSTCASRECSTNFQPQFEDQNSSLLQKSQPDFINYPNIMYDPPTPHRMGYMQPAISISSISSTTNIPPSQLLTFPRCTRLSTFHPHECNEATL